MSKRDYYEVLGVDRNANEQQLKSAYRKLAKEFHPDRNPGDAKAEQNFKDANEAYEVLKDQQKRAAYDQFGHGAFEGGGGPGGFGPEFAHSMEDIFENFFGDIMGGRRGQRGPSGRERGSDLRYNMDITLEEAYSARLRKSACQPASAVTIARAVVRNPVRLHAAAEPAAVTARFALARAFSRLSAPVMPVRDAAK